MHHKQNLLVLVIPTCNQDVNGNFISDACGQIRIINPLLDLIKQDDAFDFEIIYPDGDLLTETYVRKFDIVWTNRTAILGFSNYECILEWIERSGIALILDMDDALLTIDLSHPEVEYYQGLKTKLVSLMQSASIITCSTEGVATDVMLNLPDAKTRVIRNSIAKDQIWEMNKNNETPVICYYGTSTHKADFSMIETVMYEVADQYQDARFPIIGVLSKQNLRNAPKNVYTVDVPLYCRLHYRSFISYLSDTIQPDYVLAPLVKSEFNMAKSELKSLEALSLGAVPIVSKGFEYDRLGQYLRNEDLYCEGLSQWREALTNAANGTLNLDNFDSKGCWDEYNSFSMAQSILNLFTTAMEVD